jgi:hypothetical protein
VTDAILFTDRQTRLAAAQRVQRELALPSQNAFLCNGLTGVTRFDAAESSAWRSWAGPVLSPKKVLGEGLVAGAAWQCVAAVDELSQSDHRCAGVSVVGCQQAVIGARFSVDPG